MGKSQIVGAVALLGVLAFGGYAAASATGADPATDAPTAVPTSTSAPVDEPAAVETPAPSAARDDMNQLIELGDARYLEAIRRVQTNLADVSDQDMIGYAADACAAFAEGKTKDQLDIIHGQATAQFTDATTNFGLAIAAADNYCIEYR